MDESLFLYFLRIGDIGITKNFRGISLTAIAAKVYDTLFQNRIRTEVEKNLRKS